MLRRLNDALPGLVAGILIWGALLQAVGVWFVADRTAYSVGLWYGIIIAVGMAINMASVIYDSTFEDTDGKTNYRVVIKSVFRYVIIVVLYAVLGIFGFGNVIAAFCGTMGLKVSAYMQQLLMKLAVRLGLREAEDTEEMQLQEEPIDEQVIAKHSN